MSKFEYTPEFGDAITDWYRVFAFIPHWTADRGWKWLTFVYRRRIRGHDYLYPTPGDWWQYCKIPPTPKKSKPLGDKHGA